MGADAFVRIFAGTAALAPRIEASLRQTGSDERLTEIRLSPPTADEVATILAYADAARPGGPVLTPDAIAANHALGAEVLFAEPGNGAASILGEALCLLGVYSGNSSEGRFPRPCTGSGGGDGRGTDRS